jgi:GntR family transcriptional repressor for pyruvate dehydrogenase complex
MSPHLRPVQRQSLSDAVFEQIRDQIVRGERRPGSSLPAERALCDALGVNRSAVREALRRLEQAGLVVVRQGGASRVRDYRESASLDLLSTLLVTPAGDFDPRVVRSILEMRSAIGPDTARLAATRAGAPCASTLDDAIDSMRAAAGDLAGLQECAKTFWSRLVDGSDNVAYRLAFNALHATYDRVRGLLAHAMEPELSDVTPYVAVANAVRAGDGAGAEAAARELLERGARGLLAVLERVTARAEAVR